MRVVRVQNIVLEIDGAFVKENSRLSKALEMACDYCSIPAEEFNLKYKNTLSELKKYDLVKTIITEIAESLEDIAFLKGVRE